MKKLKELIENKQAKVAIVGLGYIGLPQALEIARAGFSVTGIDSNQEKIRKLRQNDSYLDDVNDKEVKEAREKNSFQVTTGFEALTQAEVVLICVPTPLTENKAPDLNYIKKSGEQISEKMSSNTLVILESTTYPGTTDEELKPILESNKRRIGRDFYLAFSPERIDPGREISLSEIPRVVGAYSKEGKELTESFYGQFVKEVHSVSSPKTAEMTKMLENTYRLVNISMINELTLLADKLGVDIWEVIEAAKTKPYGYHAFYPSPKAGGHCIPLDPFYLSWRAKEENFWAEFIENAGEINERMPHFVITKVFTALNRNEIALSNSKILVWGVSYKKDIGDARESAALDIIPDLIRKKADVRYFDPYVEELQLEDKYLEGSVVLHSIDYSPEKLEDYDLVLILTDHSNFDYEKIAERANLVVDTRNAVSNDKDDVFSI